MFLACMFKGGGICNSALLQSACDLQLQLQLPASCRSCENNVVLLGQPRAQPSARAALSCSHAGYAQLETLDTHHPCTPEATPKMHHHAQRPVFNLESSKQKDVWKVHGAGLLMLLLLGGLCLQGYRWYATSQPEASNSILYTPLEPRFLGRNYKLRVLEQQVLDKDNEIRYLKYQIDKAAQSAASRDSSISSAELTISQLTQRNNAEIDARTKAQIALAEKSSSLTVCNSQREGLQSEVERCGNEVMALTHRRQSGAIIGTANGNLGGPVRTRQ